MKRLVLWTVVCIILMSVIAVGLAVGCGPTPTPQGNVNVRVHIDHLGFGYYRLIDVEAGVVCYARGGTWCLPIGETRLDY